jgi:heat shock protein 5
MIVQRIINEPVAAAIAYSFGKKGREENIVVYDLGGGTFDVTLIRMDNGFYEVIATNGDTHLGGEDFDQRVMQYFIEMLHNRDGNDISNNKQAIQKLRREVERVKRILSLEVIPKPVDATDALALAITHAWRGEGTSRLAAAVKAERERIAKLRQS